MPVIDSHQHFWQLSRPFDYRWLQSPDKQPIYRDYLPGDLEPYLRKCGIDFTVFVQTQHNLEENRWILALADQYPWIAGVVGWVDLASRHCEQQLHEMRQHSKFVGVRHIVQDEPDDDFLLRPEIMRGLRLLERFGLSYDLLLYTKHLKHAFTLGMAFPSLHLVIDHLAKPEIRLGRMDNWLPHLKNAAKCPNIYVKLSGMVTEADWKQWKPTDLKPYVHAALDLFGPQRCMYGSDWPVCELAATYEQQFAALNEILPPMDAEDRGWVFGETARKFYRLELPKG
ncbi:MAG: amidohydrolase family protein [Gemmataceae bacterium]